MTSICAGHFGYILAISNPLDPFYSLLTLDSFLAFFGPVWSFLVLSGPFLPFLALFGPLLPF